MSSSSTCAERSSAATPRPSSPLLPLPPVSSEREHITVELDEFVSFMRDVRGVAAPTRRYRFLHVRAFLRDCFPNESIRLASLKSAHAADFVPWYAANWTPASNKTFGNSLHSHFRCRTQRGEQTAHLVATIPRIAQWHMRARRSASRLRS